MKNLLKEELGRISEIMGLKNTLLVEQPIPTPLVKNILKQSDDLFDALRKMFKLSDDEASKIAQRVERNGVESLSDDFISNLSTKTIDNFDDLAKLLKRGGYLGDMGVLSEKIFQKADSMTSITSKERDQLIEVYKKTLDDVPFLEGYTDLKNALVNDFKNEFNEKYSFKLLSSSAKSIDDLLNNIGREGDSVSGKIDNLEGLTNEERSKLKRYWTTFWTKKESFYDSIRKRANLVGDEAAQLKGATDSEIESLIKTANNADKTVKDKEALTALRKSMGLTPWKSLPTWVRWALISLVITGGTSASMGYSLFSIILSLFNVGENQAKLLEDAVKESVGGGVTSLNKDKESLIFKALIKLQPSLFEGGVLKNIYTVNYYNDGSKLEILDDNYDILHTYTKERINDALNQSN